MHKDRMESIKLQVVPSFPRWEGHSAPGYCTYITPVMLALVTIMQLLVKPYKSLNPESRSQVLGYESHLLLKLTPPPDASDKRMEMFNFIELIFVFRYAFLHPKLTSC